MPQSGNTKDQAEGSFTACAYAEVGSSCAELLRAFGVYMSCSFQDLDSTPSLMSDDFPPDSGWEKITVRQKGVGKRG